MGTTYPQLLSDLIRLILASTSSKTQMFAEQSKTIVLNRSASTEKNQAIEDNRFTLRRTQQFQSHPDWAKLKVEEKYAGAVSKINEINLLPRPYSQL